MHTSYVQEKNACEVHYACCNIISSETGVLLVARQYAKNIYSFLKSLCLLSHVPGQGSRGQAIHGVPSQHAAGHHQGGAPHNTRWFCWQHLRNAGSVDRRQRTKPRLHRRCCGVHTRRRQDPREARQRQRRGSSRSLLIDTAKKNRAVHLS